MIPPKDTPPAGINSNRQGVLFYRKMHIYNNRSAAAAPSAIWRHKYFSLFRQELIYGICQKPFPYLYGPRGKTEPARRQKPEWHNMCLQNTTALPQSGIRRTTEKTGSADPGSFAPCRIFPALFQAGY